MTVRVEFARGTSEQGAMTAAANALANQIAVALAQKVRRRVEDEGRTTSPERESYSTEKGGYAISPRYPVQPAGRFAMASGATWWKTSAEYHAAARVADGTYSVSGGMWDGLTVMLSSATFARVLFRGRSEGQQPKWRGKGKKATGVKVSNALKAATILRNDQVSLLELTDVEFEAMAAAATAWVAQGVDREVMADVVWPRAFDTTWLD